MQNMTELLEAHFEWTEKTFGPGRRTKGITEHIRKELVEIENDPSDLMEWIDVILLGLDGARRTGASPADILLTLEAKHNICKMRHYPFPDNEDEPSEHERDDSQNVCSKRGLDWLKFSSKVFNHIDAYTVPQYGDCPNDQLEDWSIEACLEQVKKYINRYGRNARIGQQELDFIKMAHYIQVSLKKHQVLK